MRLVIISDTHNQHEELGILHGDVLIHCGDIGNGFGRIAGEVDRLDDWLARAGNGLLPLRSAWLHVVRPKSCYPPQRPCSTVDQATYSMIGV
jgi:hypothetical protein